MVIADANCGHAAATIVVQPNRCLSWHKTKLVFFFFLCCLIAVGLYFYSLGAWMVVPFAGLELFIIGTCLYLNCLKAHQRQIIQIDDKTISIRDGHKHEAKVCFPKAWLKIVQTQDSHGWYPSRLFIASHGKYVEIGNSLIESERKLLADNLRCAIQGA